MQFSSSAQSPPRSLSRLGTMSSGMSRKTYSRRASAHREKRKAEARQKSDDSSDGEGRRVDQTTVLSGRGSPVSKVLSMTRSLIGDEKADDEDDEMLDQISVESPVSGRSPSPSPSQPTKRAKTTGHKTPGPHNQSSPKQTHASAPEVELDLPSSSPSKSARKQRPSTPPRRAWDLPGPSTPTSSSRDLSSLFAAVSPRHAPNSPVGSNNGDDTTAGRSDPRMLRGRPGGMRRMLSKTQSMTAVPMTPSRKDRNTDDAVENSPFGGIMSPSGPSTPSRYLARTQSMPESPIKTSPQAAENAATSLRVAAQAGNTGSGGRAKRTYGKTRTMLSEVPLASDEQPLRGLTAPEDEGVQASYTELRQRYEVDNSTAFGESSSGSGNLMSELLLARAPQTVSDMRSKGENRRFMDELGYLLDGISDAASSSSRRTSSMEILRNMLDETWLSKLKVCGQVEHIWDCLYSARNVTDKDMNAICLLYLATLLSSGSGLEQLLQVSPEQILSLVVDHLRNRDGVLDYPGGGSEARITQKMRHLYRQMSSLGTAAEQLNTRFLASTILNGICQETINSAPVAPLNDDATLVKILKAVKQEISLLDDRFELYEKGLELFPNDIKPDFWHIRNLLQVISTVILGSQDQRHSLVGQHEDFAQDITEIMIACSAIICRLDETANPIIHQCLLQALQLQAYLSNEFPSWATTAAKINGSIICLARLILQRHRLGLGEEESEVTNEAGTSLQTEVDVEGPSHEPSFFEENKQDMTSQEFLCLILALLTTIALTDKDGSTAIARIKIDADCMGQHACLRHCRCSSAAPFGDHLSLLYLEYLVQEDDPLASTLTGYLALLISRLLVANHQVASTDIIATLPGTDRQDKLQGLLSSLRRLDSLQAEWQKSIKHLLPQTTAVEEGAMKGETDPGVREEGGDVVEETISELKALIGHQGPL